MAHVMDEAHAVLRPKAAIEHRQVFLFDVGCALDRPGRVNMRDDLVHLLVAIAEFKQRGRHRVVHDFDDPAAHQLLVFHQRQVGLDAGGVAVHHEPDGAGRRQYGGLRVAESVNPPFLISIVPAAPRRLENRRRYPPAIDVGHRFPVHPDDFQEG
jgi:hypothetical protein